MRDFVMGAAFLDLALFAFPAQRKTIPISAAPGSSIPPRASNTAANFPTPWGRFFLREIRSCTRFFNNRALAFPGKWGQHRISLGLASFIG